jgi:hypothetical protein
MLEGRVGWLKWALAGGCLGLWVGCAASKPKQAEDPDPLGLGVNVAEEEAEADEPSAPPSEPREASDAEEESGPATGGEAEPEFTENMSVEQAINAVPPGVERLNIEQEIMAEPLQDPDLYAPCKLTAASHFKIRVAVWDGKAVGVDIKTMPKNPRLAECLNTQLRALTWPEKVKSLNTVEYSY